MNSTKAQLGFSQGLSTAAGLGRAMCLAGCAGLLAAGSALLTGCQNDDDDDDVTTTPGVVIDYADRLVGHYETDVMLVCTWVSDGQIVKILTPCVIPNPLLSAGIPVNVDISKTDADNNYNLHLYYNATVANVDVAMLFRLDQASRSAGADQPFPGLLAVLSAQISGLSGTQLYDLNGVDYTPYSGVYKPAMQGGQIVGDTLTVAFKTTLDQLVQAANKQPSFALIPKMVHDQVYKEMGAKETFALTMPAAADAFEAGAEATGDAATIAQMKAVIAMLGMRSDDPNAVELPMSPEVYQKYEKGELVVNPMTVDGTSPLYIQQLLHNNTTPLKTMWEQIDIGIVIKVPVCSRLSATPKQVGPGAE